MRLQELYAAGPTKIFKEKARGVGAADKAVNLVGVSYSVNCPNRTVSISGAR